MNANFYTRVARTTADATESWFPDIDMSEKPNILLIVLDDVGFAQLGCCGSSIRTPNIDRLAKEGLQYVNFHTEAICSPSRAALLTGRNAHSVGFGHITERFAGYPGYNMRLPDSAATVAKILRLAGYSTRAVGKWHLTPPYETGPQGPFDRWPLGRGFDRFYGYLGGETDQFAPELYRDNSPVPFNENVAPGYHLSADLADEAIREIRGLRSISPLRPFFMYLAFAACHAPHQAPQEWIDSYRGVFDHGWDYERSLILRRQIDLGVMPVGTKLAPANPGVQSWGSLSAEQRRLYARMMEVYAGFLSFTDAQIGRVLDCLDATEVDRDTCVLLLSDNGASGEGGPEGSVDEGLYFNDRPQLGRDALERMEKLGSPELYNHYPWGWAQAGNTPFRWYKQFTYSGGIRNCLLIRWPGGGIPGGEIRRQYHHIVDVTATVLDIAHVDIPNQVCGVTQDPMHGISMRYTFSEESANGRRKTQHYESWGNRGLWHEDWMAISRLQPDAAGAHPPAPIETAFDDLVWELYDHRSDPTECNDLAHRYPQKLRELIDIWWAAAGRYNVLPVDIRTRNTRWPVNPPRPPGAHPESATLFGPGGPYERGVAPQITGRSFTLVAEIESAGQLQDASGVIYALGGRHGGYCWYLYENTMYFEVASSSIHSETVCSDTISTMGHHVLAVYVEANEDLTGRIEFTVDGRRVGGGPVTELLRRPVIGSGRTYVGYAACSPVSGAFTAPFPFDGLLYRVRVATSGESGSAGFSEVEPGVSEQREQD